MVADHEINMTKLANNVRTSTERLVRFYVPQLESSQFTKGLRAKKRPKIKKTESAMFITTSIPVNFTKGLRVKKRQKIKKTESTMFTTTPIPVNLTKLSVNKAMQGIKLIVGKHELLKIKRGLK